MHQSRHALLFIRPFDADTKAVDLATGKHGFGHVALWNGVVERDQPIVLDSSIGNGVNFRPLREMTRGVPYAAHYLDDKLGAWIFARAMRCIGAGYHYKGLISTEVSADAFTCSGLVCCALPVQLDRRCRDVAATLTFKAVSPNAIAMAMGVPKWSPRP